jgi:hypothetical protein
MLESLSISSDGNYIVASTSRPGIMYVFAKEQDAPQWEYSFGNLSGAAKISSDGNYIVATGGDKMYADDPSRERRVFQFARQNSFPSYQKSMPELPPPSGLSISSNGSIFVVSYTNRSELMLFNRNIQPYGPNSIRTASLPSHRVAITMSSDGRYIFVGTAQSVLFYEYWNNLLTLKKQYSTSNATICDLASSSDGRYVVAVGYVGPFNNEHSFILFFDNSSETRNTIDPWTQWSPLIAGIIIFTILASGFVFYRRRKISKNSLHQSVETSHL